VKVAEQVADGIAFPEGLSWSADEGCLLCSAVQEGAAYRICAPENRKERLADVGGGANNLVAASGGGAVVCQNGGVDAGPRMTARYPDMTLPAIRHASRA
jgi:sugar lactone lactonase YvrE